MAVAVRGSVNAELHEGMTDGSYKKVNQNRTGAEATTYESRRDLKDVWYGIHETPVKRLPGGGGAHAVTPNFVPTPPAEPTVG